MARQYTILMHREAFGKAESYRKALGRKDVKAGKYLKNNLVGLNIAGLETVEFIERLIRTKRPQIFAESAIYGDGSDWSQTELSILGDVSVSVPVMVFDNGGHSSPSVHSQPFSAILLYLPGAMLRNGWGRTPADWDEITFKGQIDSRAYYLLYERRLLPAFLYLNKIINRQAIITIPGLGCGQFAGKFHGQLGAELRNMLIKFLEKYSHQFPNIRAVYFDPYRECDNERLEIDHITFFVRPLTKGNADKSQLCSPQQYAESGDDFSDCILVSFVAWDHVSWPGNDFYIGSRVTDDGVKAAATDSMAVMTGIEGYYNTYTNMYHPPDRYKNWGDLVLKEHIQLQVKDNLVVLPTPL